MRNIQRNLDILNSVPSWKHKLWKRDNIPFARGKAHLLCIFKPEKIIIFKRILGVRSWRHEFRRYRSSRVCRIDDCLVPVRKGRSRILVEILIIRKTAYLVVIHWKGSNISQNYMTYVSIRILHNGTACCTVVECNPSSISSISGKVDCPCCYAGIGRRDCATDLCKGVSIPNADRKTIRTIWLPELEAHPDIPDVISEFNRRHRIQTLVYHTQAVCPVSVRVASIQSRSRICGTVLHRIVAIDIIPPVRLYPSTCIVSEVLNELASHTLLLLLLGYTFRAERYVVYVGNTFGRDVHLPARKRDVWIEVVGVEIQRPVVWYVYLVVEHSGTVQERVHTTAVDVRLYGRVAVVVAVYIVFETRFWVVTYHRCRMPVEVVLVETHDFCGSVEQPDIVNIIENGWVRIICLQLKVALELVVKYDNEFLVLPYRELARNRGNTEYVVVDRCRPQHAVFTSALDTLDTLLSLKSLQTLYTLFALQTL